MKGENFGGVYEYDNRKNSCCRCNSSASLLNLQNHFGSQKLQTYSSIYKNGNRQNRRERAGILGKEKKNALVKSLFSFYINRRIWRFRRQYPQNRIIRDCGTGFYLSEKVLLYASEMSLRRKEMPKNPRSCSFVLLRYGFSAFFRKKLRQSQK